MTTEATGKGTLTRPAGPLTPAVPWNNFEHQIYSIRHIQPHGGQLIDRLRSAADIGTLWVGRRVPCTKRAPA